VRWLERYSRSPVGYFGVVSNDNSVVVCQAEKIWGLDVGSTAIGSRLSNRCVGSVVPRYGALRRQVVFVPGVKWYLEIGAYGGYRLG
jgi:hypothetical protein